MTNRQFVDLVRQYQALATRQHKSYAEQVQTLVGRRMDAIERLNATEVQKNILRSQVEDVIRNEYAPVDASYPLTAQG